MCPSDFLPEATNMQVMQFLKIVPYFLTLPSLQTLFSIILIFKNKFSFLSKCILNTFEQVKSIYIEVSTCAMTTFPPLYNF
jgi:hypothetical protein